MNIREVYQILRDRFQGKTRGNVVYNVIFEDNNVILTATIHGDYRTNRLFSELFRENIGVLSEVADIFETIEKTYSNNGFKTLLGVPTEENMLGLDDYMFGNGYTMYFKNIVVTTQLTIFGDE